MTTAVNVTDLQVTPNDCPLGTTGLPRSNSRSLLLSQRALSLWSAADDPLNISMSFHSDQPLQEVCWEVWTFTVLCSALHAAGLVISVVDGPGLLSSGSIHG